MAASSRPWCSRYGLAVSPRSSKKAVSYTVYPTVLRRHSKDGWSVAVRAVGGAGCTRNRELVTALTTPCSSAVPRLSQSWRSRGDSLPYVSNSNGDTYDTSACTPRNSNANSTT